MKSTITQSVGGSVGFYVPRRMCNCSEHSEAHTHMVPRGSSLLGSGTTATISLALSGNNSETHTEGVLLQMVFITSKGRNVFPFMVSLRYPFFFFLKTSSQHITNDFRVGKRSLLGRVWSRVLIKTLFIWATTFCCQ